MRRKSKKKRPLPPAELSNLVGWMGVSVLVPEEWSPVTVSAEGANGYLKIVSPDSRYLEIKWEQTKGAVSVPDALERYRKKLAKTARKGRQEFVWRLRPRGVSGLRPKSQAPISYAWEADREARGAIWHCGQSNRMVIAELVGDREDDLSLAAPILRSIVEHSEAGWNEWGMDGLRVAIPEDYRLEKHVRMSGNLRLDFARGGRELQIERWGLAGIVLRDTPSEDWYCAREDKTLRRLVYQLEETTVNGHPALRLQGRDRLPAAIGRTLRRASRLTWPAYYRRAWIWSCPASNRIFAISAAQRRRDTTLAELMERFRCHHD